MKIKGAKNKDSKFLTGFTIVEIIVTITLLSLGILGIYSFFHPVISASSRLPLRVSAVYLAKEGLEITKNIRDSNIIQGLSWSESLLNCSTGCQLDYKTGTGAETPLNALQLYTGAPLALQQDGFYSYDAEVPSLFKRKVTITQPFPSNSNILLVDVLVMWDYQGKPFNVATSGYLYNF